MNTIKSPRRKIIISVHLCDPDAVRVRTDGPVDFEVLEKMVPMDDKDKDWYRVNSNSPCGINSNICG